MAEFALISCNICSHCYAMLNFTHDFVSSRPTLKGSKWNGNLCINFDLFRYPNKTHMCSLILATLS